MAVPPAAPRHTTPTVQSLLVILGPTASGKSALAHSLARRLDAEILAVDSMSVYCGMDLGTAKPTPAERREVPYHALDLVDPNETFTVARWLDAAEAAIADAAGRGVPLIAAGGTPLYYQALFHGLFEGPPPDPALRARLEALPADELHRRLAEVDPESAARLHLNDRKRLVRALEVFEQTGQPISRLQTQWAAARPRLESLRFGMGWDRPALNRRINARTRQMIAAGWLDEVRRLLDRFGDFSPTAAEATGYRILADHLRDPARLPLDDAVEKIKIRTRQLARRQMTWFRRFSDVTWLPGDRDVEENTAAVLERWQAVIAGQ